MMVRVRFAPSPTGYLHIGSARTALFSWLYARRNNGKFILRIEDTDKERSKKEYLEEIIASLKWLYMESDEEMVFQSRRFDIYKRYAQILAEKRAAYREGPAIIFKVNKDMRVSFDDIIHGNIEVSTNDIKDQVLIKSDGTPTYNFACVIDDADMKITHVIRGDDHISNTPKQVMLYEAIGFPIPKFAHIPLILSKDGGRLSKRHGATSISEYRKMGFLPDALVNYLALLGWAPGNDVEIMALSEIVRLFDIKDVNKTGAIFDMDKLTWMNGQYIKNADIAALASKAEEFLKSKNVLDAGFNRSKWNDVVRAYSERAKTLQDFVGVYKIFFSERIEYDDAAAKKYIMNKESKDAISKCISVLEEISNFNHAELEGAYRSLAERLTVKAASLIHPTRVAISGKTIGAGLFEMMEILGKEKVIVRMRQALTFGNS